MQHRDDISDWIKRKAELHIFHRVLFDDGMDCQVAAKFSGEKTVVCF